MNLLKMLADLRLERAHIDEVILTLERLACGRGRRRGRPPAWMTAVKRRGRPPGSKNKPKNPLIEAASATPDTRKTSKRNGPPPPPQAQATHAATN